MDHIAVRLSDGVTIAVPPSLASISTYVLLEQERWFEKECDFVQRYLKPGMTAIDIGANLGVYSMPMARKVAPGGKVFAYEPASEPRRLQEISKQINKADNLEIVAAAMSDAERQGHLTFGASSELNSLEGDGPGEDVRITSLDREDALRAWSAVDFVKIDAEGEEERILAGGREFFARHSPLVMYEIKAGAAINAGLASVFAGMGYESYRSLPGDPILLRCDPASNLDDFELNMFGAKAGTARKLADDGLLVDPLPQWTADLAAREAGLAYLKSIPFVKPLADLMNFGAAHDAQYIDGLSGYAYWHDRAHPVAHRCAALADSFSSLQAVCRRAPNMARLSTFARCALDWGRRAESVAALRQLLQLVSQNAEPPSEPFWPAGERFSVIVPAMATAQSWFLSAAAEQLERLGAFSSCFTGPLANLQWLSSQPFVSAEMLRRILLLALRARQPAAVPERLLLDAPGNLNAELWRQHQVIAALKGQ